VPSFLRERLRVLESDPVQKALESPPTASLVPLFRPEVAEFQQIERQYGRALLVQPIPIKITSWLVAAFVALSIVLLVIGQYSRKATVSGYLVPAAGTARIFVLRRGTITKVHVRDGEEVHEHQPLLTIDAAQISATGEDVDTAILDTLVTQRYQLERQIVREEERKASERERLTRLIQGFKAEVAQLEAQIPLQEQRINIVGSLVDSIQILAQRGTVTTVELKRRQAELLEQKKELASLKQQLPARRNQLTDTEYSLAQLPIVISEKIQALRNELSTINQRIAEINVRRGFVVRAPIAGRVSALQASVGKVAEPNQLQLEIVPPDSMLKAELFIPSRDVGFVRVGQEVSLRYDAFPYQNFGRYAGKIVDISQNILAASDSVAAPVELKEPAYKVIASLDRQDVDAYGKRMPLQAGMLLKADVVLDRRSLARWLLDPLLAVRG
jgi:membrane fusion protein